MKLLRWLINLFKKKEPLKLEVIEDTPFWYKIALAEIGNKEIFGPKNNPRILEYHMVTHFRATDDETPWCSAFVCWCLENCRPPITSTQSARARSYLNWGMHIDVPHVGCIVVLKRGKDPTQGHVGFFVKEEKGFVYILSGNQNNEVNISPYPIKNLLDFRWPATEVEFNNII